MPNSLHKSRHSNKAIKQGINTMPDIARVGWLLKSCPKCGGDLYYDMEIDSEYMHCLQCAYQGDVFDVIKRVRQHILGYGKCMSHFVEFGRKDKSRLSRRRPKSHKGSSTEQPNLL